MRGAFSWPPLVAAISAAVLVAGCDNPTAPLFQGYVEGEYIRVAAPLSGSVMSLSVQRGDRVREGDPLFVLEQESELAARNEAQERLKRSDALWHNVTKGKRPDELAVLAAQHAEAEAARDLSSLQLARQRKLLAAGSISPSRLDEADAQFRRDRARVEELAAQLRVGRLGGRDDEIQAAAADGAAARASLVQAEWRLTQKNVKAPVTALVHDLLYLRGEWVPAGMPVVVLLPPENLKIRFFLPEPLLARVHVGQTVRVACDGCGQPFQAQIRFISPQAEYTPPILYNRDNRAQLLYMVEARVAPEESSRLHPGQPLEVDLGVVP